MDNAESIKPAVKKSIAVIGGGMTGIAAALQLAQVGRFDVYLFEKEGRLGGLSGWFQWQDIVWDRFYHVVLSTDTVMLAFLKKLGLEGELFWQETRSGFYREGRLVSMASVADFIRFPFLTIFQKFRLALGILYSVQLNNPTALDRIYARQWLTKVFGRRVYETIWDPLLRSKLGDARERTSASFIWATIKRLYGARSAENKREKMGHVHGGYRRILEAAEKKLTDAGVTILTNHSIENVTAAASDPSLNIKNLTLKTSYGSFLFDKVLMTADCPTVLRLIQPDSADAYWERLARIEYLGVICLRLILKNRLSPYYVINFLDPKLPFTGIIEATNLVPSSEVGGRHIVYLPKYLTSSDPLNQFDDKMIREAFLAGLKKVFPVFKETDILDCEVCREKFVQPLQEINHLDRLPAIKTPMKNLFVANSSMIYNSTLNNNAAVKLGIEAAHCVIRSQAI